MRSAPSATVVVAACEPGAVVAVDPPAAVVAVAADEAGVEVEAFLDEPLHPTQIGTSANAAIVRAARVRDDMRGDTTGLGSDGMIKAKGKQGKVSVTFSLDPAVGARSASVCGDWNEWLPHADVMTRAEDGSFGLVLELPAGKAYRFRYLLDDDRWENDWAADAYRPNDYGGDDSVVDLTEFKAPAAAAKVTPAAAAKKAAATKKAAPKKSAS